MWKKLKTIAIALNIALLILTLLWFIFLLGSATFRGGVSELGIGTLDYIGYLLFAILLPIINLVVIVWGKNKQNHEN